MNPLLQKGHPVCLFFLVKLSLLLETLQCLFYQFYGTQRGFLALVCNSLGEVALSREQEFNTLLNIIFIIILREWTNTVYPIFLFFFDSVFFCDE